MLQPFLRLSIVFALGCLKVHAQSEPPLALDEAKAVTYTRAFAERFGLAKLEPEKELREALQAVSFSVEKLPDDRLFYYRCLLKVYLNSSVAVEYPVSESSASHESLSEREHFIFDGNVGNRRWLSLSEADRRHFAGLDNFRMVVFLSNGRNVVVEAFQKDLFPGISYLKLDVDCTALGKSVSHGLQLWFKRTGAKDYRRYVRLDPDDFLKFDLPQPFHERISAIANTAGDYNHAVFARRAKPNQATK